jgi:hypothetical protein
MIPTSIKLLTNDISPYIKKLTNRYAEIQSIWLFGKRANHDHNDKSDWDSFVFANDNLLMLLKNDVDLKIDSERNNIDLLIVYDGDNFKAPWKIPGEEDKDYKQGCLTCVGGFGWSIISEIEANYTEAKDVEGQILPVTKLRKAWRIWPET